MNIESVLFRTFDYIKKVITYNINPVIRAYTADKSEDIENAIDSINSETLLGRFFLLRLEEKYRYADKGRIRTVIWDKLRTNGFIDGKTAIRILKTDNPLTITGDVLRALDISSAGGQKALEYILLISDDIYTLENEKLDYFKYEIIDKYLDKKTELGQKCLSRVISGSYNTGQVIGRAISSANLNYPKCKRAILRLLSHNSRPENRSLALKVLLRAANNQEERIQILQYGIKQDYYKDTMRECISELNDSEAKKLQRLLRKTATINSDPNTRRYALGKVKYDTYWGKRTVIDRIENDSDEEVRLKGLSIVPTPKKKAPEFIIKLLTDKKTPQSSIIVAELLKKTSPSCGRDRKILEQRAINHPDKKVRDTALQVLDTDTDNKRKEKCFARIARKTLYPETKLKSAKKVSKEYPKYDEYIAPILSNEGSTPTSFREIPNLLSQQEEEEIASPDGKLYPMIPTKGNNGTKPTTRQP